MTNLLQKTDKGIATFIAIFLVFLMSTGAFIGVAENNSTYNGIETNDPILPSNKDSEIVNEGSLDISSNEVDNTLSEEYPTAIVPPSDENIDPDFIGENNNELELVDTETGENFVDPDYIEIPTKKDNEDPDRLSDVEENEFGDALKIITPKNELLDENDQNTKTRAPLGKKTLMLGGDNPEKSGQATGYIRKSGSTYSCSAQYYTYPRYYTSYQYHGFTVFDLQDLNRWAGAKVTSAKIIVRNYYMTSSVGSIGFTTLPNLPYEGASSTILSPAFTASGSGGTQIGTYTKPSTTPSYEDLEISVTSAGISALNTKLGSSPTYYSFGIGMYVKTYTSTSAYCRWADIRLEITFEYDTELQPTSSTTGGIAFGNDLAGYVYKYTTATNYNYGYMSVRKYSTSEYRGYDHWDMDKIEDVFPQDKLSLITIKKVSLRFNHYSGNPSNLYVNPMTYDASSTVSAENLFTDCGDGTSYYGPSTGTSSSDKEIEWDLGPNAVKDLQDAFNNKDFFAIGIVSKSTSGSSYMYGGKLVIEWELPPPAVLAILADDTPSGFEGTPIMFDASKSLNLSTTGNGGLRYEWDWNNDGIFDEVSMNPIINHTWPDNFVGKITLRVNDTISGMNDSAEFTITIENAAPEVDTTGGSISPQPAYEGQKVTFSGYKVVDANNDTWTYFWDFDGDGEYDVGGATTGKTIPTEEWLFMDDFQGEASLLIVDDDGASNNITTPAQVTVQPKSPETGYVYDYGTSYTSSSIYYQWQYSYDSRRGWAKIDLTDVPDNADITKIEMNGYVTYNNSVNMVGVHLLKSDPTTATGTTIFSEAGSNRLFGWTGTPGAKSRDITSYFQTTAGKAILDQALTDDWIAFGFDHESPTSYVYSYGYMRGYSYNLPSLVIDYTLSDPGCLVPVSIDNRPPVLNCSNLTVTPTTLNEGDIISISGITFCDPGNDTYEGKFVIGDFETEWIKLGEKATQLSDKIVLNEFNTGATDWVEVYNYGPETDMSGWTWYWHDNRAYSGTFTFPSGFKLGTQKFVVIHESSGSNTATDLYMGANMMWTPTSSNGIAGELRDDKGKGVDFFRTSGDPTTPTSPTKWSSPDISYPVTSDVGRRTKDVDTDTGNDWTVGGTATLGTLNAGQTGVGTGTGGKIVPGWGAMGPGCHDVNITINITIPDDHPLSGTSADELIVTVYVRDDDHHKLIPGSGLGPTEEPIVADSNSYYSYFRSGGRKLIIDDDMNLYGIYVDRTSSPYMIYVAKSKDGGETWASYKVSDQSYFTSSQYYPTLAIDSNGVLHASWRGYATSPAATSYQIRYANSNDGGETWTNHYDISTGYGYYPAIAVDGDDTVHIAWSGRIGSSGQYTINYINRTSAGVWGGNVRISEPINGYMPDIVADSVGNVHIVWYGYLSSTVTTYNIRHRMLGNDGKWSNINNITADSSSAYHYYPTIAVDSSDNAHVVWNGYDTVEINSYQIMYSKFDAVTKTWSAREYITSGARSQYSPSIAINAQGDMDVVWYGYQSPGWSSPYVIHHAQKSGSTWNVDWNYLSSTGYMYYPSALCSSPNSFAGKGFAFLYVGNDYKLYYYASEDFEFGNPQFSKGLDWCNKTITVSNVAPEIDLDRTYTIPNEVKEQEDFIFRSEFEDPAAGVGTESFMYNVTWGNGDYTGWKPVTKFKTGQPAGLTDMTLQPDADEGKDAYVYGYSSSQNYNYGTYVYAYVGGYTSGSTSYVRKGLIEWDLSRIPIGYNVTNATMRLYFGSRYYYSPEKMHWHPISEEWLEGTKSSLPSIGNEVTWSNKPTFDNSKFISSMDWSTGSGWTDWSLDLTTVQSWIDTPSSNFGMISQFDDEDASDSNYGYFYTSDYATASYHPQLVLEFDRPLPAILPRGVIEDTYMYPDDHPASGTEWDEFDITIDIRDDDLGTDYAETELVVNNVAPEVLVGSITPATLETESVPEGTVVTLEGFRFNDVAYNEPTEHSFKYSLDWGDGSPEIPWSNDFSYTSNAAEFYQINNDAYSSSTRFNGGRKLVMDSNDIMYTVYMDYPSPYQIFLAKSTDFGETWTESQITTDSASTGQYQYYPSIAIDSNDGLHVVWQGNVAGFYSYQIRYANSMDGGATWDNFTMVTTGTSSPHYSYAASIAVDTQDTVHIVWHGRSSTNSASYNIHYISRSSAGLWSSITMLTNDVSSMYHNYASIATDSEDNVHVTWYGRTSWTTNYNIQYRKFNATSNSWEPRVMLTNYTTSTYQYYPCIAVDLDDNVHVTWQGYPSPYQVKYIKFDATTESWGSVEDVTSNSYYNYYPSLGVDQRGYLYITWYRSTGTYEIMMSMNDGTGWSDETELTKPSMFSSTTYYPNMMFGGQNSIVLKGAALVFVANVGGYKQYWTSTPDFYLGEVGPMRGLPTFEHLYRDDKPTKTESDSYKLKISVRDDDNGVGEWTLPIQIDNVWPEIDFTGMSHTLSAEEMSLYIPEIRFTDPGTGPTETWKYWLDIDNSESLTAVDIEGTVTATEVIDDVTHGTIPPILTPYNDDCSGTLGIYIYDDDTAEDQKYMNITFDITGETIEGLIKVKGGSSSSATAYNNGRNLVMDSNGNMITIYNDYPSPYQIYVSVSDDMGETWGRYKVSTDSASSGQYQYYPSIAIDSNDILHAVWQAYVPVPSPYSSRYSVRYANSGDGGKTWGNFSVLDLGKYYYVYPVTFYNYEENPSVAVDGNDVVHVTWRHYNYSYNYLTSVRSYEYGIRYVNNSGGWGTPSNVVFWAGSSSPYQYQYAPSIATDSLNNVHISWYGYHSSASTSVYNILYRKLDAITGWGAITPITKETSSTYAAYRPSIVTDTSDNVHVVWYQRLPSGSYYEIRYRMFNSTSNLWETVEDVTSGSTYYQYYPTVSVDQRGHVYVAWHGNSPYMIYMAEKVSLGGSFGAPTLVSKDPQFTGYQYYPNLMGHGPNCYPIVGAALVWSGATGTNNMIFETTDDFFIGRSFEKTGYKAKFDFTTINADPYIIDNTPLYILPGEVFTLDIIIGDPGSDDLNFTYDFCDGNTPIFVGEYYNDGVLPDLEDSALTGNTPFEITPKIEHVYYQPGTYYINFSILDDDGGHTNATIEVRVPTAKELKEDAVKLLEPLVPGRSDVIGYQNLTLEYLSDKNDATVLVYNYIHRPPYSWEMKHIYTFCDVDEGEEIFIDASPLAEGMFGCELILKTYDCNKTLIFETTIKTTYSCIEPLKVGGKYMPWEVTGIGKKIGITYHHYTLYSLRTEDAMDDILFSINKDPRRGYGPWQTHWVFYCGEWMNRELWIDETHLDPEFGTIVFCEERRAVQNLMEVINNCLKADGVHNMTLKWIGNQKVDIEVYTYGVWWDWFDKWELTHEFYELNPGEEFFIGSRGYPLCGKLGKRTLIKVYRYNTGELLDAQYIRTSGFWPLEVEPGNIYGNLEISDTTLKLGCGSFYNWTSWFGDIWFWYNLGWNNNLDWDWMYSTWLPWYGDYVSFDVGDWLVSRCGWDNSGCWDQQVADEEQERVCSNLSVLQTAIQILVMADDIIARYAYWDAENITVLNDTFQDEYDFHIKMAKRYMLRARREADKGRPHRAISDFKLSWKNSILAVKWANQGHEDTHLAIVNDGFESGGWSGGNGWLDESWSHNNNDPRTRVRHSSSGDSWSSDPHSGYYYLEMGMGKCTSASWVTRSFSLEDAKTAELTLWWQALDFESTEKAYVMLSKDDGATWTTILEVENGEDDFEYQKLVYDLSAFIGEKKVTLAFKAELDTLSDRFCIDDISISRIIVDTTVDPATTDTWLDWDFECDDCVCGNVGGMSSNWNGPWWWWWYFNYRFSYFPDWKDYTDPEVWS